jgi:hypothetical protein
LRTRPTNEGLKYTAKQFTELSETKYPEHFIVTGETEDLFRIFENFLRINIIGINLEELSFKKLNERWKQTVLSYSEKHETHIWGYGSTCNDKELFREIFNKFNSNNSLNKIS